MKEPNTVSSEDLQINNVESVVPDPPDPENIDPKKEYKVTVGKPVYTS